MDFRLEMTDQYYEPIVCHCAERFVDVSLPNLDNHLPPWD